MKQPGINKGELEIQYDEKNNKDNKAWIYFKPFNVGYNAIYWRGFQSD